MPVSMTGMARRQAITRGRSTLRVPVSAARVESRVVRSAAASAFGSQIDGSVGFASVDDLLSDCAQFEDAEEDVRSRTSAKSIVDYMEKRTATKAIGGSNGASTTPHDAVVLSVLANYSGLSQERLFNMLRNSGRFNENQSTLSFILNALTSQGRVLNESGTYRFVPAARGGRSPSPAPSNGRSSSPAPRSFAPASNGSSGSSGSGTSATDEAVVLSVLQNYSGLTQERLSGMLRTSGKSVKGSVSSLLSALVNQGKVQNDNGTFRYLTRANSPVTASRSGTPSRTVSPMASRPSAPARQSSIGGTGDGAKATEEAVVLQVLSNYSGLTQERLSGMLRNSGKSVSNVSSLLSGLVSQGKVQNDNGTFRFLTRAASPVGGRSVSPTPSRTSSPSRPAARQASSMSGNGSGASATEEAVVLQVLSNYSGLTQERLSGMLRNSGKSVGNVSSLLNGLVSQGKVQNDNGTFRFLTRAASPTGGRSVSPVPARTSSPSRVTARQPSARPVASRQVTPSGTGGGATASDDAIVINILKNYSGLTVERLSGMLKSSGKSLTAPVTTILNGLVRSGKVSQDRSGMYRI